MTPIEQNPRIPWIDTAKGWAIALVVFGHVIIDLHNAKLLSGAMFDALIYVIYTIHMPLFVFLAGFCARHRLDSPQRFARKIGTDILWPYAMWTAVFIAAQSMLAGVRSTNVSVPLDTSVLWTPTAWLWFFAALIVFHGLALVLRRHLWALLAIGALIAPLDLIGLPLFPQQLCHFLIFYAAGICLKDIPMVRPLPTAAVALGLSLMAWQSGEGYWTLIATPAAIAWILAAVAAAKQVPASLSSELGKRSCAIYTTHLFFAVGLRIVLTKIFGVTAIAALMPAMMFVSIAGPIAFIVLVRNFGLNWLFRLGPSGDSLKGAGRFGSSSTNLRGDNRASHPGSANAVVVVARRQGLVTD
jgi:fucose 4-O-acetylase-like acetyltransferase